MKRALIAVAALAIALTGCTAAPDPEPDPMLTGSAETGIETLAPVTPAPANVEPDAEASVNLEAEFLATGLVSQLDLTDEEKLAAAYYACDQVSGGNLDVVALEGVTEAHNENFVRDALLYFCDELSAVYAVR